MIDPFTALLAAAGLTAGGVVGAWRGRNSKSQALEEENKALNDKLTAAQRRVDNLNELLRLEQEKAAANDSSRHEAISKAIKNSRGVRRFYQPVLLVGPMRSGKTSLLWQWHTPWEPPPNKSTVLTKHANVTLHYVDDWTRAPHELDSSVSIPYDAHLFLKVFDFPGELAKQSEVQEELLKATAKLREDVQKMDSARRERVKNLGLIVICMLDCEALVNFWRDGDREILDRHIQYYNAALFRTLKQSIGKARIDIDCLVLTFNKFDIVRQYHRNKSDFERLIACRDEFKRAGVTEFLQGTVDFTKMPHIPTVLNPTDVHSENQGPSIVKSFAARSFIEAICDGDARVVSAVPTLLETRGPAGNAEFIFVAE